MLFLIFSPTVVAPIAASILIAAGVYLLLGLLFYFPFVRKGIHLIDKSVHGSPFIFYLIILPGTLAFWPVLLAKWRKALKQHHHDRFT